MTTTQEVEWEELDSLGTIKVGDELEYTVKGSNSEFRRWGKVERISNAHGTAVILEGNWYLIDESLSPSDNEVSLKRKVVELKLPTGVCAVVRFDCGVTSTTYVLTKPTAPNGYIWVHTGTGERYAPWEIELLHSHDTYVVVSEGL